MQFSEIPLVWPQTRGNYTLEMLKFAHTNLLQLSHIWLLVISRLSAKPSAIQLCRIPGDRQLMLCITCPELLVICIIRTDFVRHLGMTRRQLRLPTQGHIEIAKNYLSMYGIQLLN